MIIFILEKVSPSLRGELTRWMLEPKAGVFVGTPSALVREKLWKKIVGDIGPASGALLVFNDPDTEWGFRLRVHGNLRREIVERDGLQLIQYNHPNKEKALRKLRASIPPKLRAELETMLPSKPESVSNRDKVEEIPPSPPETH